jgi:S1-C subfamily serine protease
VPVALPPDMLTCIMKIPILFALAVAGACQACAQQPSVVSESASPAPVIAADRANEALFAKATEATALLLTGEGGGRLDGVATAVVVRPDGVLLTTYHVLKNAQEVQVRLHSGDTFDRVDLIGFDERRDVAAIRITAKSLIAAPLGDSSVLKPGAALYSVGNSVGSQWEISNGLFSSTRSADDVPRAGSGFSFLQTTFPPKRELSGAPVLNASGDLVGIFALPGEGMAVVIPIESVAGLIDGDMHLALGGGSALRLPSNTLSQSPASTAIAATTAGDILLHAKTAVIVSKTAFFTPETLERTLTNDPDFAKLGLTLVKDRRVSDLVIEIDRPLFTYVHTYTVFDPKTTIVIESGKVTAYDGTIASGPMANQLIKSLLKKKADALAQKRPAESK